MTTGPDDRAPPAEVACTCPRPFPALVAVIDGVEHAVRPAATLGPAQALYRAYCQGCRAEYTGSWRLAHPPQRPPRTPPPPPAKQETLW